MAKSVADSGLGDFLGKFSAGVLLIVLFIVVLKRSSDAGRLITTSADSYKGIISTLINA